MDNLKHIWKNSLLTMAFSYTGVAVSMINSIAISRGLGTEGRGLYALFFLYLTIVTSLSVFGKNFSFSFYAGSRKYDNRYLFSSAIWIAVLTSLVVIPLIYFYISIFSDKSEQFYSYSYLLLLIIPFSICQLLLYNILIGNNRILRANIVLSIINGAGLFNIVFYFSGIITIEVVLFTTLFTYIISTLTAVYFLKDYINFRLSREILFDIQKYGIPMGITGMLYFGNYKPDILIINHFGNLSDVGIYSIGLTLAALVGMISTSIGSSIVEKITSTDISNALRIIVSLLKKSILLCFFLGLLMAATMWYLIPLLFGPSFKMAYIYLILLLPGTILVNQTHLMSSFMLFHIGRFAVLFASASHLLIFFLFCYLGFMLYGIEGLAISTFFSNSIFLLFYIFLIKKKVNHFNVGDLMIKFNDVYYLFVSAKSHFMKKFFKRA
jgi:O-antigen/teichoic acid export membrane protein